MLSLAIAASISTIVPPVTDDLFMFEVKGLHKKTAPAGAVAILTINSCLKNL
jgi:hypothetical protein